MTLQFRWLNASRWLGHAHVSRAMTLVLGIIGVSLLFTALRVVDAAFSGALVQTRLGAAATHPSASAASFPAVDRLIVDEPTGAGEPVDASLVQVPAAAAEAISL